MAKSKFSRADALTLGGTLIFGFFTFLSFNFFLIGEEGRLAIAVVAAIIVSLILGGLAFAAKCLKQVNTKFHGYFILECLCVLFFVIAAYYCISFFSHYFVVSEDKDAIRAEVAANIEQAEGLYANYKEYADGRIERYGIQLRDAVRNKNRGFRNEWNKLGFKDGEDDNTQIARKERNLQFQLFPSNYEPMRTADSIWLSKAKNTLVDWWAWTFRVVDVITSMEDITTDRLERLTKISEFRVTEKDSRTEEDIIVEFAEDFSYPLSFQDVKNMFFAEEISTPASLALAVALYFMMMWSWIVSGRSTRSPGTKAIMAELFSRKKTNGEVRINRITGEVYM